MVFPILDFYFLILTLWYLCFSAFNRHFYTEAAKDTQRASEKKQSDMRLFVQSSRLAESQQPLGLTSSTENITNIDCGANSGFSAYSKFG